MSDSGGFSLNAGKSGPVCRAVLNSLGKSGNATRDELEDLARTGKLGAEVLDGYSKQVQAVAESQATAKSVADQNSQCAPGTSPMTQVEAVARAMRNHHHEPDEPEYPGLEYLGSPPEAPVEDRGEGQSSDSGAGSGDGSKARVPVAPRRADLLRVVRHSLVRVSTRPSPARHTRPSPARHTR
ncbi:hypothetical protein [Segniliparus rotundus]|uniref:hypothetical protein n=1 Tax=Segniliparus rotundus TaxID=286802 RepID=UPI00059C4C75|nr:hypothetical protein [Segniliparus rotundus]